MTSGTEPAARRALVIGNGHYQFACAGETPIRGAEGVRSALQAGHFDVSFQKDLDRGRLRSAIDLFVGSINPSDFVFVYFSGYAVQTAEDARDWLLPVDFKADQISEIESHAYGLDRLLDQLDERQATNAIVVLDASRSCPALPSTALGLVGVELKRGGRLVAFAAAPGRTAEDPPDGSESAFARVLARNLRTPGLTPVAVFNRTEQEVHTVWSLPRAIGDFYFIDPPPTLAITAEKPVRPGDQQVNRKDQLTYSWIPANTFEMGCVSIDQKCKKDETPRHPVTLRHGFWITSTEVTIQAYERFTTRSGHATPPETKTTLGGRLTNHPVTKVSWQDAEDYCEWSGGSLPTEAEWEYAARGGAAGLVYPWGNGFKADMANSFEKSSKKRKFLETTPTENYPPNAFNVYDVIGNVREWTLDTYDAKAYSAQGPFNDPRADSGVKNERVVRGGSFNFPKEGLRLSSRDHRPEDSSDNQTGFRCVVRNLR